MSDSLPDFPRYELRAYYPRSSPSHPLELHCAVTVFVSEHHGTSDITEMVRAAEAQLRTLPQVGQVTVTRHSLESADVTTH
ncbi:hypothetical protein ACSNOK_15550 [Streptomyces sp. URMC 126]|uniref:hypothetical protein n=1 Tax=Streptomyces sp. URMC 126 TaxID=3423401 RepID=UPI003F1A315E